MLETCWCGEELNIEDGGAWESCLWLICPNEDCPFTLQLRLWKVNYVIRGPGRNREETKNELITRFNRFRRQNPSTLTQKQLLNEKDHLRMKVLEDSLIVAMAVIDKITNDIETNFDYPYQSIMRGYTMGLRGSLDDWIPDWRKMVEEKKAGIR